MDSLEFLNWSISLLEGIDSSTDKKEWCRAYPDFSENQDKWQLRHNINTFFHECYDRGLVIVNYNEVIKKYGLSAREIIAPKTEKLSYLETLACIAWHFRRDYFDNNSLINESIAEGALLRLMIHLREQLPGTSLATTLKTLHNAGCVSIPDEPGCYRILAPKGFTVRFNAGSTNNLAALYPASVLDIKYASCKNKEILYIGKANGIHGLRQRIIQYLRFGYEQANNHRGGRAIWQIEDADMLLLDYVQCMDCEVMEHTLLREYKLANDSYPVANWRG